MLNEINWKKKLFKVAGYHSIVESMFDRIIQMFLLVPCDLFRRRWRSHTRTSDLPPFLHLTNPVRGDM